jgi:crotonobetainyl-CoA:carnitine CoA-transferase CaiB-like acyl-CoA transferase
MAAMLHGVRVLDLTRNVAGPYCTMILGDLGADVIKVERPGEGDDTRQWRPPEWNGYSTTFLGLNRNKRSLAIDLDASEGAAIVRQLALASDIIVESFRPGSLARRGLGYEDLSREHPRVVYCSITGFGVIGPQRNRPGYDPVVQAYSGIMSITGEDGRPPVRVGPSLVDMGTGMWAALAILAALYKRERTGRSSLISTSLLEAGVAWVGYQIAGYMGSGRVPGRLGSTVAMIAPYEAFATRDEYLFVAAPNDQIFARLCSATDLDALPGDPRFRTNPNRVANREALHVLLEERLRARSSREWEERLVLLQIPCSRIRTLDEVVTDPQVEALNLLMHMPRLDIPELRLVDLPFSIAGERARRGLPPPRLGQHTDEILREIGYASHEIEALRRRSIVD